MDYDKIQSRTIDALRFPLTCAVVLAHAYVVDYNETSLYTYITFLFSRIFVKIAIPLFFFFSGFLFFYHIEKFNIEAWTNKLKKRTKSLLIPYILWNIINIFIYLVGEKVFPGFVSSKSIYDYTALDFLRCFWDVKLGYPICYQFWYIRDLLVLNFFSFLIYFLVKKMNIIFFIIMTILWINDFYFFNIIRASSVLFFSLGAYFSINKRNFIYDLQKLENYPILLFCITIIVFLLNLDNPNFNVYSYRKIADILGMMAILRVTYILIVRTEYRPFPYIQKSVLFVYAYHMLPQSVMKTYMIKYMGNDWQTIFFIYLFNAIAIIFIGIGLGNLVYKLFPRFYNTICGDR